MRPVSAIILLCLLLAGCGGGGGGSGDQPSPKERAEQGTPVLGQSGDEEPAGPALGFPVFATKNTTRVGGADPVADAAAVAQATYPSRSEDTRPQAVVLVLKRLSDLVMSAVGLIVLSPLLLAIIVAIRLTSPGPVFFVQERQGRYFRPFRMLKFRTMRHDEEVQADTSFARIGDSRVTSVGRALRRTHLDELPQLVNVLRGEMSVVGPRPEAIDFARNMHEMIPLYELRYLVRPGLTGHAQLKQGYAADTVIDTQTKLSYDLYYLCNYSLRLDVRLLLRTAFFLVRGSR